MASKFYCVRMKVKSPLSTWPKGDMVLGFIASYTSLKSEELFDSFTDGSFVISSAFPAGKIAKPLCDYPVLPDLSKEEYTQKKKEKREKYADASEYLSGVPEEGMNVCKMRYVDSIHASISRETGTTVEGALHAENEIWMEQGQKLDFYVRTTIDIKTVAETMNSAFSLGFGKKSSVGYGVLELDNYYEVLQKKNTGKYLALGPFVKSDNQNLENLNAGIFVRFGKLGGNASMDSSPYKVPVIMYDEGATFTGKSGLETIGCILGDMHPFCKMNVKHSAITPVIEI